MTGLGGKLQVDAPEDMYTMPPQRINHFISDEHLAIIESGGRDRFFDYHLAFAGAALGFLQNATVVAKDMYVGAQPAGWDIFCSVLFGGFLAAAICFRVASSTKDDPVKLVVAEIKKRQAKPFRTDDPPAIQSPSTRPLPDTIMSNAARRAREARELEMRAAGAEAARTLMARVDDTIKKLTENKGSQSDK